MSQEGYSTDDTYASREEKEAKEDGTTAKHGGLIDLSRNVISAKEGQHKQT